MAKQTFSVGQVLTAAQMTSLQQTAMGGGSATAKTTSYVLVAADAGTVVSVNSTSATTITVNTGLFAAGDTVFIQNWGSGSVTITAGTATVNTHGSLVLAQYEGGTLYFTSASAAIFFDISQTSGMTNPMTTTGDIIYSSSGSTPARLGIGSTGNVLTVSGGVPVWSAPAGGGKVLQVVSATTTTNTTINSSSYQDSGLSCSITPTSNTSKILVKVFQPLYAYRNGNAFLVNEQLVRGSTQIAFIWPASRPFVSSATSNELGYNQGYSYLDSPATTSSTTYKTQYKHDGSATTVIELQYNSSTSQMILMEIGA